MKNIYGRLMAFLREVIPGAGIGFVMMLLYPVALILFGIAFLLWFFPFVMAVAYCVSGNLFKGALLGIVSVVVVYGEYRFYSWLSKRDPSSTPTLWI